jgi:hypothetical protein
MFAIIRISGVIDARFAQRKAPSQQFVGRAAADLRIDTVGVAAGDGAGIPPQMHRIVREAQFTDRVGAEFVAQVRA